MRNGGASARTRKLAIPTLVLLAHGVVLWSMAHRIPRIGAVYQPVDDSRAVEVDLELEPRRERPATSTPSRRPAQAAPAPASAPRPSTPPPPAEAAIPLPPASQPKIDAGKDEGVRRALRQVLACGSPDTSGLTRDQQTDCFRKARPSGPLPQPFDPHEIAAFQADAPRDPILVRKPTNGCLPRLADRASPLAARMGGRAGATTAGGVGCNWSF
jgi:hypothetical protein